MTNNLLTPFAAEDYHVDIQSASQDWPADWKNTPKHVFVTVTDSTSGARVADQAVSLSILGDSNVNMALANNPVTNQYGVAECLVTFDGQLSDTFQLVASVGTSSNSPVSAPFLIELVSIDLNAPRIPANFKGAINDVDYDNGVLVTVVAPDLTDNDTVYLVWGDYEIQRTASSVSNGACTFALSGGTQTLYEYLFDNGQYDVKFYVASAVGNGSYSQSVNVIVDRVNGGGGHPYLAPATIREAEGTGYINKAMSDYGVTAYIPNDKFSYTDQDGETQTITSPLYKASAITMVLVGKNNSGEIIESQSFPFDLSVGENDPAVVTSPGDIPSDFFNKIGVGSVTIRYFVTINNIVYSVADAKQKVYYVDVVPPGEY